MHVIAEGLDELYGEEIVWHKYPCPDVPRRLDPGEFSVWANLCVMYPRRWDFVAFDVRVGSGEMAPPGTPEKWRRMIEKLSRGRIDALGCSGGSVDILELKQSAQFGSVGQLMCYDYLARLDYSDLRFLRKILVAGKIRLDIVDCCKHYGIERIETGM